MVLQTLGHQPLLTAHPWAPCVGVTRLLDMLVTLHFESDYLTGSLYLTSGF